VAKRALIGLSAALLVLGVVSSTAVAGTARAPRATMNGAQYFQTYGYRPIHGLDLLRRTKAAAARWVAQHHPQAAGTSAGAAPIVGSSWSGTIDGRFAPPDPNGAIGPNSYVEIINSKMAIYDRSGGLIKDALMSTVTGDNNQLSDPMVLWDPWTQRFYYNIWDVNASTMAWGFSKTDDPRNLPGDFCGYITSFGYNPSTDIPDYPKLGQTKHYLLIGVNHYPSFTAMHADRSDLLWVDKPTGSGPITTCPPANMFKSGKFTNLKNEDGSQAWTPVPAIQTDTSKFGFVVTSTDIECPDICGSGTKITVHGVRPSKNDIKTPELMVTGNSITVGSFTSPPDAPQKNATFKLDTLDGRLEHAVSGFDPRVGANVIWTGQSVMGGAGAEFRWYEINPKPVSNPTLVQSGVVTDPNLYIFNGAASPDRTVNPQGSAHGDSVVIGVSTSSSTTFPAVKMVSKIGAGAQSSLVNVHSATTFNNDFSCAQLGYCRWGDYGGASADPAANLGGAHGEVWLTQDSTTGSAHATWNWEALP
jgi:hypothetical protein